MLFNMDPFVGLFDSNIISDSDLLISWNIFGFLSLVNSVINPVLYGLKYKQFRKAFMSMVCRCNRCRQPNQVGQEIQTVEA